MLRLVVFTGQVSLSLVHNLAYPTVVSMGMDITGWWPLSSTFTLLLIGLAFGIASNVARALQWNEPTKLRNGTSPEKPKSKILLI